MEKQDTWMEAIESATTERDGKRILACADAFRIAESQAISLTDIGRYCNQNGIRIAQCQLGCFK